MPWVRECQEAEMEKVQARHLLSRIKKSAQRAQAQTPLPDNHT